MIAQFKKITLAVALGATAVAVAAPAEAQRYGGYRGRDNGGTAIVAGVAGLAIGAALASSANRRDDGYYYDQGYDGPVVAYPPVYQGYYESYPGYDYYGGYGYRGYTGYRGYNGYQGYYNGRRGGYDRGRGGYGYRDGRGGDHGGRGHGGGYRR